MIHPLRAWNSFWFSPRAPLPLDLLRIGLAFSLLSHYAFLTPDLTYFYGGSGAMPLAALNALRASQPWQQSLLYYITDDLGLRIFHLLTLASLAFLAVGWKTRVWKWVALATHISFLHRNPSIYYGVDNIATQFLFILCCAPIGGTLSLDSLRSPAPSPSSHAAACIRLLQIQMCVVYLLAGLEKFRGETWWSGDALWIALNNWEFAEIDPSFLARHYGLLNLLTYACLAFETSYTFLVWNRSWRPWMIAASLLLHLGIAILMGLWLFAIVMSLGNLAFLELPSPSRVRGPPPLA